MKEKSASNHRLAPVGFFDAIYLVTFELIFVSEDLTFNQASTSLKP